MKLFNSPASDHADALHQIETQWQLEKDIEQQQADLDDLSSQSSEIERSIRDYDSELRIFRKEDREGSRIELAQKRLSEAEAKWSDIQAKREATVKAIDDLRRRKDELKINATSDVVVHHSRAMDKAETTITNLQRHRAEILSRLESPAADRLDRAVDPARRPGCPSNAWRSGRGRAVRGGGQDT